MPRFFVDAAHIGERQILLTGENANHVSVVRARIGDALVVCDGAGVDYRCIISGIEKKSILLDILEKKLSEGEPDTKITLFQGLPKNDKMELIIQKCVELGVHDIVPMETAYTVSKIKDKSERKTARWQKISEAAAKQCERGIIPRIHDTVSFQSALLAADALDGAVMAYEHERDTGVRAGLSGINGRRIGVFIGPEGGFSADEAEACRRRGMATVSLGRRILRTETAGFVAIIILLLIREGF